MEIAGKVMLVATTLALGMTGTVASAGALQKGLEWGLEGAEAGLKATGHDSGAAANALRALTPSDSATIKGLETFGRDSGGASSAQQLHLPSLGVPLIKCGETAGAFEAANQHFNLGAPPETTILGSGACVGGHALTR
jgi:hypothetical protein